MILRMFSMKFGKKDWFKGGASDTSMGEDYEGKSVKDHKYFVKVKSMRFINLVNKQFGRTDKLSCVDLGCGTGETCVWLSKHFKRVVGVDYAPGMIELARRRNIKKCNFHLADSSKLDFREGSFDVAVFFNVIHHIESKEKLFRAISEARRIVKKGGLVAVVDMNPFNPVTRRVINTNEIDSAVSLGGFKKGKFPTTLTPKQCEEVLSETGLDVKFKEYLIFFPKRLSFLLPAERLLKKIPLGGLYLIAGVKV
jgi:SAM-dependent methyltransferase